MENAVMFKQILWTNIFKQCMLVSVENLYLDNGSLEFNLTGIYLLHLLLTLDYSKMKSKEDILLVNYIYQAHSL